MLNRHFLENTKRPLNSMFLISGDCSWITYVFGSVNEFCFLEVRIPFGLKPDQFGLNLDPRKRIGKHKSTESSEKHSFLEVMIRTLGKPRVWGEETSIGLQTSLGHAKIAAGLTPNRGQMAFLSFEFLLAICCRQLVAILVHFCQKFIRNICVVTSGEKSVGCEVEFSLDVVETDLKNSSLVFGLRTRLNFVKLLCHQVRGEEK